MNDSAFPTYQEAALCHHIDVKQSRTHQPTEEHTLSRHGRMRLAWLRRHQAHGQNKSLTCGHSAIGHLTFDHSRRTQRVTPPSWTLAQVEAVHRLREHFPYMGKHKLCVTPQEYLHAHKEAA